MATCKHCGAEFRLLTIFNRDMQGLCNAWKHKHEFACDKRTPLQRVKWAKPYLGKDRFESSLVVDSTHPGFIVTELPDHDCVEDWYEELLRIAAFNNNKDAVTDFDGWTDGWEDYSPANVYYAEFPEQKPNQYTVGSVGIAMQEFDSKNTCEAAGAKGVELAKKLSGDRDSREMAWACVSK